VVREDPARPGLLYAGTEAGVFLSIDAGAHWQPLQRDLPRTSVRDITIHGDDLVIATHGRGFYIMDSITQLRALAAGEPPGAGTLLFPPSPAIRLHPPGFIGTPMPKDEPLAKNPPDGALIDYALPDGTQGAVDITILDAADKPVRHYTSTDTPKPPDLGKIGVAPEWLDTPQPPAATPGAHRFAWDLHYEKPAILTGGEQEPTGVWAPPGAYTVVLTANGQTLRQPLQLRPDPRLKLGAGDLRAQFDLACAVEAARVSARTALKDAAALRKAHPDLAPRVDKITGEPFDPFSVPKNPLVLNTITELSGRLDKLAQAVDGADAAPSADARTGFKLASAVLKLRVDQLKSLQDGTKN
jgi:hypothetical protein